LLFYYSRTNGGLVFAKEFLLKYIYSCFWGFYNFLNHIMAYLLNYEVCLY